MARTQLLIDGFAPEELLEQIARVRGVKRVQWKLPTGSHVPA